MRGKKRYIQLSEEQRAELRQAYKKDNNAAFRERCQIILFSDQGDSIESLRERFGCSRGKVVNWMNRYESGGLDGLRTAKGRGRPPIVKITNKKKVNKILRIVARHPQKLDRALAKINKKLGVNMSRDTLKRLLKKKAGAGNASAAG